MLYGEIFIAACCAAAAPGITRFAFVSLSLRLAAASWVVDVSAFPCGVETEASERLGKGTPSKLDGHAPNPYHTYSSPQCCLAGCQCSVVARPWNAPVRLTVSLSRSHRLETLDAYLFPLENHTSGKPPTLFRNWPPPHSASPLPFTRAGGLARAVGVYLAGQVSHFSDEFSFTSKQYQLLGYVADAV